MCTKNKGSPSSLNVLQNPAHFIQLTLTENLQCSKGFLILIKESCPVAKGKFISGQTYLLGF